MSPLLARATSVIPLVAAVSLVGKEGYPYQLNSSGEAILCTAVADVVHGIIGAVTASGLEISAIPCIGTEGTVRVKLGATVSDLRVPLAIRADGTAGPDPLSGARTIFALPLEAGAATEMIECVLFRPAVIAAGAGVSLVSFPITLADLSNADVVTNFTPGFAFAILGVEFVQASPVTTAADAATINLEIGATDVTGGVLTLTSALCTPLGKVLAGTAITAANIGTAASTISVEASAVTAFAEGSGSVVVRLQNLDTLTAAR